MHPVARFGDFPVAEGVLYRSRGYSIQPVEGWGPLRGGGRVNGAHVRAPALKPRTFSKTGRSRKTQERFY